MRKFYIALVMAGFLGMAVQVSAEDVPLASQPGAEGHHQTPSPEEKEARKAALLQKLKHMSTEDRAQFLSERKRSVQQKLDAAPPEQKEKYKMRLEKIDAWLQHPEMNEEPK